MKWSANRAKRQEKSLKELRFNRTQSYFDKSKGIRLLIGLTFAFFLFLFLHFRQTYVETLELGSTAKRYVVAQVDFVFPDTDATVLSKQQAAESIGKVYKLDEDFVYHQISDFQNTISKDGEANREWNALIEKTHFKQLSHTLSLLNKGLQESRFTDAKTMQMIEQLPDEGSGNSPIYFVFVPSEENLDGKPPVQFWNKLAKQIYVEEDLPPEIAYYILNYFSEQEWKFQEDQGLEYHMRKLMQSRAPERYTHVIAGERIIDQGEKVTNRHIAMMMAMKEKIDQRRNLFDLSQIIGSLLMTLLFLFVAVIYVRENHKDIFYSNQHLALLATIVLLNLLLAKLTEVFFIRSKANLLDLIHFPLFVPFASILLGCLINMRIAAFATLFLSIIFTLVIPVQSVPFIVINIITATVAILSMRKVRKRKEVFFVCGKAWLSSIVVIIAFYLYDTTEITTPILTEFSSTFIFMGLTAIVVVGLLPILESLFQIMTDITLLEFLDPDNEFLRRLMIEAPGTFQHSMVVGSLSEAAATAIGANGLFCRVATEYHDIGKLQNPGYFTENQLGGIDMHQLLTAKESAQVIINHVSDGVAIARKIGLPESFIDIIKEHHGTTLVYYFFHKQIETMEGDKSKVEESDFRYSGPKPRTKESTIIMLADTLEAAARSLDDYVEEAIAELVDTLVAQKIEDGQLDESPLTFEELNIIKKTFVKNLTAVGHQRIKYPSHHPGEEG